MKNHFEESKISECSICYSDIIHSNFVLTNCNHIYCIHCIKQCMQLSRDTITTIRCPFCRQNIQTMMIPIEDNEIKQFQCVSFKQKMKNPSFMEPEPIMPVQEHNIEMYELEEQYQMNHILTTFLMIILYGFVNLILILWSIIIVIISMTVLYYFIYIIMNW